MKKTAEFLNNLMQESENKRLTYNCMTEYIIVSYLTHKIWAMNQRRQNEENTNI